MSSLATSHRGARNSGVPGMLCANQACNKAFVSPAAALFCQITAATRRRLRYGTAKMVPTVQISSHVTIVTMSASSRHRPFFPPADRVNRPKSSRPRTGVCGGLGPRVQSFFRFLCRTAAPGPENGEANSELPRARKASVEAANDVTVLLNPC